MTSSTGGSTATPRAITSLDIRRKKWHNCDDGIFSMTFRCYSCGGSAHIPMPCGKRFSCKPCARKWAARVFARYNKCEERMENPKLVTLTLLKVWGTPAIRIRKIVKYAKRLRYYLSRRGIKVKSSFWVMEVDDKGFPHIHAVWDTTYIPQTTLAEIWGSVTGDSMIVDIRAIKHRRRPKGGIASYLTKYLTKTFWNIMNGVYENVVRDAIAGTHFVGSWGVLLAWVPRRVICFICKKDVLHFQDLRLTEYLDGGSIKWKEKHGHVIGAAL